MRAAESATVTTGPASEQMRTAFGAALEEAMRQGDTAATAIASHVGLTDDAVRKWINGKSEPAPLTVFAVERLLQLAPGDLSRHLGYVPVGAVPLTQAIDQAPDLSDRDKLILRQSYRTMRG